MAFDLRGFQNTQFQARTDKVRVDVEGLIEFFEEDDEPVFVVRGLSGEEIARCREAAEKNKTKNDLLEGVTSENSSETVEAVKQLIGATSDVPNNYAMRLQALTYGSVDPDLSHEDVVKLGEVMGVQFLSLTDKILELSGQGHQPGKKKGSGKTQR